MIDSVLIFAAWALIVALTEIRWWRIESKLWEKVAQDRLGLLESWAEHSRTQEKELRELAVEMLSLPGTPMSNRAVADIESIKDCVCGTRAKIIDARPQGGGWRRRYECPDCRKRWTTVEVMAELSSAGSPIGGVIAVPRDWSRKPRNEDR